MIVGSGFALAIPVMFSSGIPDGDVTWRLYDASGTQIASGAITPAADAVSINITTTAAQNTLSGGALYGSRDIEWTYDVLGAAVNGAARYSIEGRCPFGASNDGVRNKLGVEPKDLLDCDISLIRAYLAFRTTVTAALLSAVTDDAKLFAVRDAIEAQAALSLISTMQVRVAASEDSGTNAFKRQNVDWAAVAQSLADIINLGILAVDPAFDPTPIGALFIVATPTTDPVTGAGYV